MATERVRQQDHDLVIQAIDAAVASDSWEERLSALHLVQELLRDLPTERTVERLVGTLDQLARDTKWEVRRAAVPALVQAGRPAARSTIDRLTGDGNQWVRQAAERAKRKLARITTPAEKRDRRARFAFDAIKDLQGQPVEKIYEKALLIGERYYEELAADTAHELNTFRTAMEGLLQELEHRIASNNGMSEAVGEIVGKIRERSGYLKSLVTGLVEYAKEADLEFQVEPLAPIVGEALDLARDKTRARLGGQRVQEILAIPAAIEVEACKDRLVQALVNILSNAFEALAGKGDSATVRIEAETDGTRVVVKVADTGSGMDADQVENAAKRFRSLKGSIGLGLPLALKIIQREHRGRLEIESELGAGTTIMIDLPVKREGP